MFIERLNHIQQGVFLSFAEKMINADRVVEESELEMLESIKLALEPEVQASDIDIDKLPEIFNTKGATSAFLLELVGVGMADGEFHDKEYELLCTIASKLDVSSSAVEEMQGLVSQQYALMAKFEELLED